jgi:hypothetical protein
MRFTPPHRNSVYKIRTAVHLDDHRLASAYLEHILPYLQYRNVFEKIPIPYR